MLEGKITFAGLLVSALVREREPATVLGLKRPELKTARPDCPSRRHRDCVPLGLESVIARLRAIDPAGC
ncbi:hypothetical protein [Streptomyces sp. NPDC005283]|uniref:hypothetical protein n=1 Tax=Streptomyces sp. NPDC005283 TaxID=3156871 RepID=UPI003456B216